MANLKEVNATGDVVANKAVLHSVTLTGGADASSIAIRDGSTGSVILTLKAAINTTVTWVSGSGGVFFGTTIHATVVSGTTPLIAVEYS